MVPIKFYLTDKQYTNDKAQVNIRQNAIGSALWKWSKWNTIGGMNMVIYHILQKPTKS